MTRPVMLTTSHGDGASGYTPRDLEAVFDDVASLVIHWWEAQKYADNCPASERDVARGKADEAKDAVYQLLGQVMAR